MSLYTAAVVKEILSTVSGFNTFGTNLAKQRSEEGKFLKTQSTFEAARTPLPDLEPNVC